MSAVPIAPIAPPPLTGTEGASTVPFASSIKSFGQLLRDGVANTEAKVVEADRMAKAFVLDDSIPVHQVTYALENARLSLELMLQVRSKLVEGYQQLMNMQI